MLYSGNKIVLVEAATYTFRPTEYSMDINGAKYCLAKSEDKENRGMIDVFKLVILI